MTVTIRRLLLILAMVMFARPAWSETSLGRLQGVVVDTNGSPLANVTVIVTSKTQIGGARRMQTDREGNYRALGLTPGSFAVRYEAPGFQPVIREGLYVGVNEPVELDVILEGMAAEETREIKPARTAVETRRPVIGQNFDYKLLENIPLRQRNAQSVISLAPGTATTLGGGGAAGEPGNPNIRGATFLNNTYSVDGFDTTDMVSHTFGTNFNYDAVAEMQVQTAALGAEYSMTPGGVANIVTKSGSNQLTLDSSFYYTGNSLVMKRQGEGDSNFSDVYANLNVGAPIVKDKLWFFGSFAYSRNEQTLPGDPTGTLPGTPSRVERGMPFLGKLTWALGGGHKLTAWFQGSPGSVDNFSQQPTTLGEAEMRFDQDTRIASLSWDAPFSDRFFLRMQAGYQRISLDATPQSCMWDPAGCQQIPQAIDITTGITSKSAGLFYHDTRNTLRFSTEGTYFAGNHEFKSGVKFTHAWSPVSTGFAGNSIMLEDGGNPAGRILFCLDYDPAKSIEYDPNNLANSRCQPGALNLEHTGQFFTYYLQDTWSPTRYLHITPGVAFDFARTLNERKDPVTSFVTWTPHFKVAWDPTKDGKTSVLAGFNQYVDGGYLYLARFGGRSHVQRTCFLNSGTGQYDADCFQEGGPSGATVGKPDPSDPTKTIDLTPPRTSEAFLGLSREVASSWWLGGDFVFRYAANQFEDVETNTIWSAKGDRPVGYKGPQGQSIKDLQTPDEAYRRYWGITLNARKVQGPLRVLGSWTISKSEGTYPDTSLNTRGGWLNFFDSPYLNNASQNRYFFGPMPEDHRHVIRAIVSYDVTENLRLGAVYMFQTGSPYNQYFLNPTTGEYSDLRAPRGQIAKDPNDPSSRTEARLPSLTQLDVHMSYSLRKLLGGQNLLALVDVFNILNERTPISLEERNLSGAVGFASPTLLQQPFQVRFGLRYVY